MTSLKQAVKEIRTIYVKKGLRDAFDHYVDFLPFEFEDFQLDDINLSLDNEEVAWIRTRRGGKSRDLTVIGIFYALLEYKVIWRSAFGDQLKQAGLYLHMNPFVKKVAITSRNEIDIHYSPSIDIGALTKGKTASMGCDVLIYDEGGKVPVDHMMYQFYLYSRAMIAASLRDIHIIHATTPCRLTAIEEVRHTLPDHCISYHTYKDCWWVTDKFVQSERKKHVDDPWYIDQEYLCLWVARGDTAFRNVYVVNTIDRTVIHGQNTYDFGDHPFFPLNWEFPTARKAGVDFNDAAGHYVVIGSVDDDAIYVNEEYVVTTIPELIPFGQNYNMEVESGPFEINMRNAYNCTLLGVKCMHQVWGKDILAARFRIAMDKMIVIDRHKAPFTLGNLVEAVFDDNARESKLKKSSKQHGLDAMLHMIHKGNYIVTERRIITNLDPNYHEVDEFGSI